MAGQDKGLSRTYAPDELFKRVHNVGVSQTQCLLTIAAGIKKREKSGLPVARCIDITAAVKDARLVPENPFINGPVGFFVV